VSIRLLRRAALLLAYPWRRTKPLRRSGMLSQHLQNAERVGLFRYLDLDTFTHRSTDGPLNPYARVYSRRDVTEDFSDFEIEESFQRYMHAPPLPVHRLPGERWLGWHLWVRLLGRRAEEIRNGDDREAGGE
jgi:hypothetical protein